jgi:hypothetical protein
MRARRDLCALVGIYARHGKLLLVLGDLCSSWEIYARPGGFMLALGDLCSSLRVQCPLNALKGNSLLFLNSIRAVFN